MSLRKYSNLELLKEVYRNLARDDESIDELCERELVALIEPFYQVRHLKIILLLIPYLKGLSLIRVM